MSIQQAVEQKEEELSIDFEEIIEDISKRTIPGPSNDDILGGLEVANVVVPKVIDDLNNWFYILDVRTYSSKKLGIPMRYRWSVIRWAENEMDDWLSKNGWEIMPHLNADSRFREEYEMEARYRKYFDNVEVDCNFLVEFPPEVFEEMADTNVDEVKKQKERERRREQRKRELIAMKREG